MRPFFQNSGAPVLIAAAALALAACGESAPSPEGAPSADSAAAGAALEALDDSRIAGMLSTEAQAALDILGEGARTEIEAYRAQYGELPASLSELASLETARAAAVTAIADALAEQVPFVRRETLEQMAGQFVDRAGQRVLEQAAAAEGQTQAVEP